MHSIPVLLLAACSVRPPPLESVAAVAVEAEPAPEPEPVVVADGFDFPVGAPDGVGYFDAQPFGQNHHLGSDWNGVGGGDTDRGDPVTAAAAGVVIYAEDAGPGWGNVVILRHTLATGDVVETLYGHLDEVAVTVDEVVARGDRVGTLGDAGGRYVPHLHFELRTTPDLGVGGGYAASKEGWTDPTAFIRANRPGQPVAAAQ